LGIDQSRGDAIVIMMADESDDCRDVVRYWKLLGEGWDAVFGSRFIRGCRPFLSPHFNLTVELPHR
jgi:dolichol-phosphate mannosyltransferase